MEACLLLGSIKINKKRGNLSHFFYFDVFIYYSLIYYLGME